MASGHNDYHPAYGRSMIVDPWGVVLAVRTDPTPGVVVADLDFSGLAEVRERTGKLQVFARNGYYGEAESSGGGPSDPNNSVDADIRAKKKR